MDTHPSIYVDQISIPSAPVVSRCTSPAPVGVPSAPSLGTNRQPFTPSSAPPVPFVAHREGRFFIIQELPASLPGSPHRWRCILATAAHGYVTHRDFGPHDSDYLLAVQFGREFEEGEGARP